MDFEDAPPLVYFEGVRTGRLDDDPATLTSSYGAGGYDCLEITHAHPALIPVRDSKTAPHGPSLTFRPEAWSAFVDGVKQ
ncbi:DUF397 domain-containing protein [Streptomyces sp. NPDC007157]|uniref:DUF397 domain-containing protein n=1 Tax=Streptomyces sp. NPDC007157 TaxID=3154681 RepID=UPI0033ED5A25